MTQIKPKNFTEAIKRLEEITSSLESPDLDLEDAINLIDEGVKLHKYCREKLKIADEKIKTILKENGSD